MKKMFFYAVLVAVLISSCTYTKAGIVFDESIPLEQTSWIITAQLGDVVAYNGISVNWSRNKVIQVPSGDTLLELNLYIRSGNSIFAAKGALFRYNFQPEKQYWLLPFYKANGSIEVSVYAWNIGETAGIYDEKHFVETVRFLNLYNPENPTVLN